jgi:hypothetical protein
MSLTELALAGNNNYSRPGRVCLVTSRLGTAMPRTFFYSVWALKKVFFFFLEVYMRDGEMSIIVTCFIKRERKNSGRKYAVPVIQ